MRQRLLLIDGYGFIFRAFHSLPPLTRPTDNKPVGAIYGFVNMLYKLLKSENNDEQLSFTHIAIVLDSPGKNFRHQIYSDYKAHRPPAPPELIEQLGMIEEVVCGFGLKSLRKSGYEADDIIASYTKYAKSEGMDVLIVSSDKDLMQLIDEKVSMYDAAREKFIQEKEVVEKFGVSPIIVRDALSLMGDSSDNIPGVKGIGPKTAAELLNTYRNLDGIYSNIESITQEKRRNALLLHKADAYLSYQLVALCEDALTDYALDDLRWSDFDHASLYDLAKKYGFKSLAKKIGYTDIKQQPDITFLHLHSHSELTRYIDSMHKSDVLFVLKLDNTLTLTFGEHNLQIEFLENTQNSLLLENDKPSLSSILYTLGPVLESDAIKKVSFDAKWWHKNARCAAFEDIEAIWYCNIAKRAGGGLSALVAEYCSNYEKLDSYSVKLLYESLYHLLSKERLVSLYDFIDKKIPKVIAYMETKGVKVEISVLQKLSTEFSAKLSEIEKVVFQLSSEEFNIGSAKQVGEVLFEKLKLPYSKKSSGTYTTDAQELENLVSMGYEIAEHILRWRQYSKLISTYTDSLPKSVNNITKRVHSTFSTTSTSTGRFSSHNPNLQNIPIKSEDGSKIRHAFTAESGNLIISADYSQIELRLLAHYASIDPLIEAFKNGEDIHTITASQIFKIPHTEVTHDMRRQAKTINFSIIYGISPFGLASRLGIPQHEAKHYIEQYFKQYPGIKDYMSRTLEFARANGYVSTIFGRKCEIAQIQDKNFAKRSFAERAAINAPLQASSADIIKKAMVSLEEDISQYLILQIHDELLFEAPAVIATELADSIKETMESVCKLKVPLVVNVGIGKSWGEIKGK